MPGLLIRKGGQKLFNIGSECPRDSSENPTFDVAIDVARKEQHTGSRR